MALNSGERQVAPTIDGIRRDHVARYRWAAKMLPPRSRVLDLGCGVGYGAWILAKAGHLVFAIDADAETIAYARQHYAHGNIFFSCCRADQMGPTAGRFDAVTCFETIEHVADPLPILRGARDLAAVLLASVPNEDVFPFKNYAFHHRHYRPREFESLLGAAGYGIESWWGQAGPESEVEPDLSGRTLIAFARAAIRDERPAAKHIAIVGLGHSAEKYVDRVKRMGSRRAFCDETWAINAMGSVLDCDIVFHMDDIRIQELRAAAQPDSNIARMVEWLRGYKGRVITSVPHPDYPSLEAYPLEAVMNCVGRAYFNNTVAYALAYALYRDAGKISIFGCDYTYPNAHKAEKGRACLEFWLGYAAHRGVEIALPPNTCLMDMIEDEGEDEPVLYGYDAVKLKIDMDDSGRWKVGMTPRDELPTAAEIEAAYDHGRHPLAQRRERK